MRTQNSLKKYFIIALGIASTVMSLNSEIIECSDYSSNDADDFWYCCFCYNFILILLILFFYAGTQSAGVPRAQDLRNVATVCPLSSVSKEMEPALLINLPAPRGLTLVTDAQVINYSHLWGTI